MFEINDIVEHRKFGVGVVLSVDEGKERYRVNFFAKGEHFVKFSTMMERKINSDYSERRIEIEDEIVFELHRDLFSEVDRRALKKEDLILDFKIGSKISTEHGEFTVFGTRFSVFPEREIVSEMFRWKEIHSKHARLDLYLVEEELYKDKERMQWLSSKQARTKQASANDGIKRTKKSFKKYIFDKYGIDVIL